MAIYFYTDDPKKLLNSFKSKIDQNEKKGKIESWTYDKDGDFTHSVDQWRNDAWLRPSIDENQNLLVFNILKPKNEDISTVTYSIYHGRFIESMLAHCDKLFTKATATALPEDGDKCSQ